MFYCFPSQVVLLRRTNRGSKNINTNLFLFYKENHMNDSPHRKTESRNNILGVFDENECLLQNTTTALFFVSSTCSKTLTFHVRQPRFASRMVDFLNDAFVFDALTCSRREDGLSCRHGVKPPTHSPLIANPALSRGACRFISPTG